MSAPFTTRPFLLPDYENVLNLWQAAEGVDLAEGDSRPEVEAYLRRNPGLSRVAEAQGRIVGAVLCGHDGRRGILYHLAVSAEHRGQGIGRQLARECVAGLHAAGLPRVLILVEKDNVAGREFWITQGFEAIDDALGMSRATP